MGGGGCKDIYYAFFGNVVRGEIALFRLVVRNGFAHFVRKVFARRKLLPGKFWVFLPLEAAFFCFGAGLKKDFSGWARSEILGRGRAMVKPYRGGAFSWQGKKTINQ